VGSDCATTLDDAREAGLDEPMADLGERFGDTDQVLDTGETLSQALGDIAPELQ
jgi:hypothetical protein